MESMINNEINHHGDFCVIKYCLLKFPVCATKWVFGQDEDLDSCAVFSLLVNNNYDISSEYIEKYAQELKLTPLTYCTVDDFPPASKNICEWLNENFSYIPSWNYYITAWCIMGEYKLPNLQYAYDHEKLAERFGKTLPEHTITLTLRYKTNWIEDYVYDNVVYGNYNIEIRNRDFNNIPPSLDTACTLETMNWRTASGESKDYAEFEWEFSRDK